MNRVFSSVSLLLLLALVVSAPGCATTSSPPVAPAVVAGEDLSGDWTGHRVIGLGDGVQMHMRGTHQLKRASANHYDRAAIYSLSVTVGGSSLPLGKVTYAATVKNDLSEECETAVTVAYGRPEPASPQEIAALSLTVEQYEALLNQLAATATVEDFNEGSTCDTVVSHSKDEVVLQDKDGDKMTYQRTQ